MTFSAADSGVANLAIGNSFSASDSFVANLAIGRSFSADDRWVLSNPTNSFSASDNDQLILPTIKGEGIISPGVIEGEHVFGGLTYGEF